MKAICPHCKETVVVDDETALSYHVNSVREGGPGIAVLYMDVDFICPVCYEDLDIGGDGYINLFKS